MSSISIYPECARPSERTIGRLFGGMESPEERSLLYRMDNKLGDAVGLHVQKIVSAGYAEDLSSDDFFHGHLMVSNSLGVVPNPIQREEWMDVFLKAEPHFIYHTRENVGPRHPYRGPPRSLVGIMEGDVFPLRSEGGDFISHGTVHGSEPFEFNGHHHRGLFDGVPLGLAVVITAINGERFVMRHGQFLILEDESGRYELDGCSRFDVYYDMVYDSRR